MDPLFTFQAGLLKTTKSDFLRFLYFTINWKERMIAIKGPRGAGKTTLLLQRIKSGIEDKALYVTADHPWFYTHHLLDLAEEWVQYGGRWLFIDEVHKYPNWSAELKNIYDGFPELQVVFSSSSALNIFRGEADLSRRVRVYELPGLSFREYLELKHHIRQTAIPLEKLLTEHGSIAQKFASKWKPLPLFRSYMQSGYLPFAMEADDNEYWLKLAQTVNTVLESDLASIEGYSAAGVLKIKKLLGVIAASVPFTPNISSLARKMNLSRDTVYMYMDHLVKARLLNVLHSSASGTASLQKPDKIYLENTNLAYALALQPEAGALRETYLINQLVNAGHSVSTPKKGDILLNKKYTIEIGGKNKTMQQVAGIKNAFIAADQIETGFGNKIPLWLWGMLY